VTARQAARRAFDGLFDEKRRVSYRRLLAWSVGTWLVYVDKIDGEVWQWVTIAFIAGEVTKGVLGASSKADRSEPEV
jgi:hypothetical protein